jgi:hypothetical protein
VHIRPVLLVAALCLAGGVAAADTPGPLTVPDLVGPRALALQAGLGSASGTEALFLNPAAIAARKRYTVDAFFLTDRRPRLTGSDRQQDDFGASVVDSVSTPVAAGLSYVRALRGLQTGTLLRLALAGQVVHGLYAGVQGNYFDLEGAERVASTFNADAGLLFQVTRAVSVGGTAYNLISNDHRSLMPRSYGVGIAAGSDSSLQVVADWRVDLDRVKTGAGGSKTTNRFGGGVEYLLSGAVPVRAGYEVDDTAKTRWWAAGIGYTSTAVAVDLGFRQSTTDARARTFALAVRFFVPNE